MRVCDLRVRIVRDGHEPNEAEEQRPCRVPIEPVHVVSPRKDRREQEGYQHSAKASRGFGAFALRYCDAQRRQPVHLDRPAAALTASVIRSPWCRRRIFAVPPTLLGARQPLIQGVTALHLPTPSGGFGSISRAFEPAAVVFSPIVAPVMAHIVEVRPGAHDGIQSDIAPSPKSAGRGLAPLCGTGQSIAQFPGSAKRYACNDTSLRCCSLAAHG